MTAAVPQAVGTAMARLGSLVLGLAASVVVSRSLQPAGRGTYHLITTIAGTAMALGHLSVEQAQTTLWADTRFRPAVAANSLLLGAVVGGAVTVIALGLLALAGSAADVPHLGLIGLALVGVPLGISTLYLNNIIVLDARMRLANRALLAGAGFQCGWLIVLGLGCRLTVATVIAVWVASLAVPYCLIIHASGLGFRGFDLRVARRTVATGLSYHAGPAAIFLLLRVDVFILAALASAREVGIYSLAVGIAEMSRFTTDAVAQVGLSRQLQGEHGQSAAVTARITRFTVLAGAITVSCLMVSAPLLVPMVYGQSFSRAAFLLALLAPGVFALGAARPVSVFLLRFHSAAFVIVPAATALAVNVALNLLLISAFGVAGCCAASSIAYIAMAALQVRLFARTSGSRAVVLLPRRADVRAFAAELTGVVRQRRLLRRQAKADGI